MKLSPLSRVLLPLRLGSGFLLARSAVDKIAGDWLNRPTLAETIRKWVAQNRPYDFYLPWLKQVVLPHAQFFSYLLVFAELVVGTALLLGLFTRLIAALGLVLMVQISLAQGDGFQVSASTAFALILIVFLLEPPGRIAGLDRWLRKKLPRWRDLIS